MLIYKHISTLLIILAILLFSAPSFAKEYASFGPIRARSQNPYHLQTINLSPTRATVKPKGTWELRVDSSYSNIFETGVSATNWMLSDMELWRISANASYVVDEDMELSIEVPFIHRWGGFLDPFIQYFHNLFDLPNGGRNLVDDNQFLYRFYEGNNLIYDMGSHKIFLSDINLRFRHNPLHEGRYNPATALFFDLKLPTGMKSRGMGGGNIDYGFGVALEKSYKRLHGYLDAAYYISGRDDALAEYMHQSFLSYVAAVEFTLLPTWSIIAQINGQTPLLKGTWMGQWDGVPLDLVIGFRGEEKDVFSSNDLIWQFGFSEDVTSGGPSVDFTVLLSIGIRLSSKPHLKP